MKRMIGVYMFFILMVSMTACQNAIPQTSNGSGKTLVSQVPSFLLLDFGYGDRFLRICFCKRCNP